MRGCKNAVLSYRTSVVEYLFGHTNAPMDCGRKGAMKRIMLIYCGLFLGLVAEVILWNSPHWYSNEEDKVPTIRTQIAGVTLVVQGAIVALVAALEGTLGSDPAKRGVDLLRRVAFDGRLQCDTASSSI